MKKSFTEAHHAFNHRLNNVEFVAAKFNVLIFLSSFHCGCLGCILHVCISTSDTGQLRSTTVHVLSLTQNNSTEKHVTDLRPQPIPTLYSPVLQILCLLRQTIPLHNIIMNPSLNYQGVYDKFFTARDVYTSLFHPPHHLWYTCFTVLLVQCNKIKYHQSIIFSVSKRPVCIELPMSSGKQAESDNIFHSLTLITLNPARFLRLPPSCLLFGLL